MNECQFADDVALLAMSHDGAEEVIREYHSAVAGLGLSVSFKFLVAGHGVSEEDQQPIVISSGNVECVSEFTYLGSQMTSDGKLDTEVKKHIAAASRVFDALHHAVFQDGTLSVLTKKPQVIISKPQHSIRYKSIINRVCEVKGCHTYHITSKMLYLSYISSKLP